MITINYKAKRVHGPRSTLVCASQRHTETIKPYREARLHSDRTTALPRVNFDHHWALTKWPGGLSSASEAVFVLVVIRGFSVMRGTSCPRLQGEPIWVCDQEGVKRGKCWEREGQDSRRWYGRVREGHLEVSKAKAHGVKDVEVGERLFAPERGREEARRIAHKEIEMRIGAEVYALQAFGGPALPRSFARAKHLEDVPAPPARK
eukprot:scaffold5782_cov36-Phaeocystis_antarctica.AAC.4